jgi:hypothetical protein
MKPATLAKALLLLATASGCGNWHALRPVTANNVQVGQLTLYVISADFALRRDLVKVVVLIDNVSNEPQPFDPQWLSLRGSSGRAFPPTHVQPNLATSVLPGQRMQTTYMFSHVPDPEVSQLTLLVAGTDTMKFTGVY